MVRDGHGALPGRPGADSRPAGRGAQRGAGGDRRGRSARGPPADRSGWERDYGHRIMTRPDFFIVGAPKTGTTSLHQYLRQHPGIFMPAVKELNYFGSDRMLRHTPKMT